MALPLDDFYLETLAHVHGIAGGMFIPFAINRLARDTGALEATLTVHLRLAGEADDTTRYLRLHWSAESLPPVPLGLQEHVITEHAALAVGCILIWHYAALRIEAVAAPGERFDYWTTDGEHQRGLEISGTITEELESRHQEKVRQLRSNPRGIDGHVVTVSFATRTAIFSFNRFAEVDR